MSFTKSNLRIDWATHEAAAYACKNWHYSRSVPAGASVKVGVWESEKYIGCVIFSRGANNNLLKPYGLTQAGGCERTRIALTRHVAPVSRIMRLALMFLRKQCPTLRLIVSFADPEQGHHGGVYQAGGWVYVGTSQAQSEVVYNGKVMHKRTAHSLFGTIKGLEKSKIFWKHKYLMPLDAEMRAFVAPLSKPYPKRVKEQAAGYPPALGSETLTHPLHL